MTDKKLEHESEPLVLDHPLPAEDDQFEEHGHTRPLGGSALRLVTGLALAFSTYQLVVAAFHPLSSLITRSLHVGFLLLGVLPGTPEGYAAATFYAVTYAITSTAAFGLIVLLSRAGFEAEEIDDFKGLNQRSPWYALAMLMVMASQAGVPVWVGFFAKFQVLKAALQTPGMLWLALAGAVFTVIGAFYYLRVIKVMYFDEPKSADRLVLPADMPFRFVLSLNGLALLGLGLFGGPLMALCLQAVSR